jgi:hypothetical protein
MKLFLATNSATAKTQRIELLEKSVISAIKNTDFEIYVIFDGKKEELTLPSEVNIIEHKHRYHDILKKYTKSSMAQWLRTEIPFLCQKLGFKDEFILYTDYDVIFNKSDYSDLNYMKPECFAGAPQVHKNNWDVINSGVMLMNVHHFISQDEFIFNSIREFGFRNDQQMYNELYKGKISKLPIEYNWKHYWGYNPDAKIIHFHGPKPKRVETRNNAPNVKFLREKDIDSYNYYNEIWEKIETVNTFIQNKEIVNSD